MENFLWMIAGAVISAWTGVATTRYFLFCQEMQRARERVLPLVDRMNAMMLAQTREEAFQKVVWLLFEPAVALNSQGHTGAAIRIKDLSLEAQDSMMQLWERFETDARMAKVAIAEARHLENADAAAVGRATLQAVIEQGLEGSRRLMLHCLARLGTIRPNYWAFALGKTACDRLSSTIFKSQTSYRVFTEHLETGAPFDEIEHRHKKRKA